ncbi:hypothetical protein COX00_04340 [Candidatus Uhrbacteria bacterium CG22_combo_CG10-13_8_21_14_all_47_17]|uniref:Uncharacterized protein n=1 Tax=Candidatus Uhrbacteria bacterium CG22_combo_CG10-13_8_21_14_all_47_17 TaxID=1975041 RepID=A0A2H0BRE8_9BACT|nr:MAG: hypothetical protein COX00_04340 [Candidatus Uhrbacteria bacterium CG22_combo_CG10-13_8_21_14_all_47_17]
MASQREQACASAVGQCPSSARHRGHRSGFYGAESCGALFRTLAYGNEWAVSLDDGKRSLVLDLQYGNEGKIYVILTERTAKQDGWILDAAERRQSERSRVRTVAHTLDQLDVAFDLANILLDLIRDVAEDQLGLIDNPLSGRDCDSGHELKQRTHNEPLFCK